MKMNKSIICMIAFFSLTAAALSAADLIIDVTDIRLSKDAAGGGYHLYIRKKPDVNSVILTETTKDPMGIQANYAYRAAEYNPVNGDEKRILNGEFLVSEYAKYSLVDSTPETHADLGQAFHIYIPEKLLYGYPWARNGEVIISKGTFVNIRAFEKLYADYTGGFFDNPFMFDFEARKKEVPAEPEPPAEDPVEVVLTDSYNPVAAAAFEGIAETGGGKLIYSKGVDSIVDDMMASFDAINPKDKIDVVFAVDATGSMKDDIEIIRRDFIPRLEKSLEACGDVRIGLILYRDYADNFKYRGLPLKYFPFTRDRNEFFKNLNSFKIIGTEGGDIPEAVYEALYGSLQFYDWNPEAQRKIILIGDAEPHPKPRGTTIKCTKVLIDELSAEKKIRIDAIITPDDKARRRSGK